jgi:CRP-like cAMP-binding protein
MLSDRNEISDFLSEFSVPDQKWLVENGLQQEFLAAQAIDSSHGNRDHIHLIQEGVVSVYQRQPNGVRRLVAQAVDGELVGEVAWLVGKPIVGELIADLPAVLLTWSRPILEEKLTADPDFASAFYRAIAASCARKALQNQAATAQYQQDQGPQLSGQEPEILELQHQVRKFKALILEADRAAVNNFGRVPPQLVTTVQHEFCNLVVFTNTVIGSESSLTTQVKAATGKEVQEQFLPYVSLTETADRFYSKPRGYAGDFLTIAKIYENKPAGAGRLGALMDASFLATSAAAAVRNRRPLVAKLIDEAVEQKAGTLTRVTSLACGPAQEIFDVYERRSDASLIRTSLIDIDLQALAFVHEKATLKGLNRFIEVFNQNLLHLVIGRKSIQLPPQDLIYSIGLIAQATCNSEFEVLILHSFRVVNFYGEWACT